ncbi:MAG: BamA/TamA family outer membrane protein [Polyangiaceae bacterium]|nr:BamA/TamA family outer membrane protein [Polyangiaceae bacterium]
MACTTIPKGMAAVDTVDVEGTDRVSSSDVEERLATAPTKKFLGLFRGIVYDYSLFDRSVLQRDLERVERFYRARGYYEAKARAGRVLFKDDDHVEVTIVVEEGEPVLVHEATVVGLAGLSEDDTEAARDAVDALVERGEPFEEEPFNDAQRAVKRALTDRGYAFAKVQQHADVDLPRHRATVVYAVTPGPKATFGATRVEGLKELTADGVLRAMNIDPGDAYSTSTIDRGRDAILALGTFTSVEIEPQLADPPPANAVVPLVVRVREQKLRSVILGGGFQFDSIRARIHLQAGWEDRNLFGGYRHFQVDLKPGINLYPTRVPTFETPTAVLPEERFRASLRQPGFLEARMTGVITQELNTFPLLLGEKVAADAPVVGYVEYKGSVGTERSFARYFFVSPTYNFQYDFPFTYVGALDPNLTPLIVSYIGARGQFDYRDDRLKPHKGVYVQNDFQFAGLGGSARDFRIQPEVRGYIPLGSKVTLATRATVGFLFPLNYGETAQEHARRREADVNAAALTRDLSLIYLRGFFSGGPSSNRGYPLRGVGPHGTVPFLNPGISMEQLALQCQLDSDSYDEAICEVPLGGMSLWEASLELRFPIYEPLGASIFCDASDVSVEQLVLRFNYPHLSCGAGLRYDTPIGPVRVDVGYRIPGAQVPSGVDPRLEGDPDTIFGAPIAIAFGLGEAF